MFSPSADLSLGVGRVDQDHRVAALEAPDPDPGPSDDEGDEQEETDDVWKGDNLLFELARATIG